MNSFEEHVEGLSLRGRFHDLIRILEEKIPETNSQQEKLQLELQLAEAFYSIRDSKKAKKLVEEILPVIEELGDHLLVGNAENLLGKIYRLHQRYSDALIHYQNAEKAFKLVKNNEGLSKIYHNCGNVYIFLEKFKEAHKFHFKALKIALQEGKKEAIASSHLNIGSMFYQKGEVDQALSHFKKARDLLEEIQDIPNLAATYLNLAETFLLRRDYLAARKNSSKAGSLYEKQSNFLGQRLALITLARSEKASGSLDKAIEIYNKIIDINPAEEILLELGECYLKQNQVDNAKKTFEMILGLSTRSPHSVGYSLDYLARIAIDNEDFDEARKIYTQLVKVLGKMTPQDPDSIASTQGNIGFMCLKTGNLDRAWEYFCLASDYFKKRKIWDELITLGSNYRNEFVAARDFEKAITVLQEYIIPSVKKSKDKIKENQYQYEVALLHHLKGDTEEGLRYWRKSHRKVSFQKYSAPFIASIREESTKKELEKQHLGFLKQVLSHK
ncbi:MAG: tetratricopeptide repeat protein [Candidatus Hodarchaeales archaeon]|jgi:tetratricopeptide (TPR) repeat protein